MMSKFYKEFIECYNPEVYICKIQYNEAFWKNKVGTKLDVNDIKEKI